nr:hypothetical protein [Tanacetum cinerariifolium]
MNALQTLLPQIREEICEEFRTGSGSSNAGGNPTPVTIHTWLECFNKQKPHSFEKATTPVDAENWISHMEKIFDVMGCEDAFKTRLAVYKFEDFKKLFFFQFFPRAEQERLKREYHSIRQTSSETSTEFMQCFLRLAGFLGAAAGTEEEQAKNFQWGLRRSTLNHLVCMSYMDVAQVANAARNYEILHERDDQDTERPDKRGVNALQTLLPQIHAKIHEEFRTSSRPTGAGGNPPPVTIHTWLESFNKQKPHSFEKATAPVDAENWISHMEKIFDVMGCKDAFKTRLVVYKFDGNALAWWKAYKQAKGSDAWLITNWISHIEKIFDVMGCEDAFKTSLAVYKFEVANVARNYEILHERDDDDTERPAKRNFGNGCDQRNRGHQSNRLTNSGNSS